MPNINSPSKASAVSQEHEAQEPNVARKSALRLVVLFLHAQTIPVASPVREPVSKHARIDLSNVMDVESANDTSLSARQLPSDFSAAAVAAVGAPGLGGGRGGGAGSTRGVSSEAAGGADALGRVDRGSEGEEEVSLKSLSKQIADMNLASARFQIGCR